MAVDGPVEKMGNISTPDMLPLNSTEKCVCGGKGGWGSGDDRIVGVKPQEITGKWEIKPQNMTG
jgi:hypothetical protein